MENICIYDRGQEISRIIFRPGLSDINTVLEHCAGSHPQLPVYLIYDSAVASFAESVYRAVSGVPGTKVKLCGSYVVETAEERKNMSTVLSMADWLLENGADRDAFILAVGGGITTDMAGFAASIYKRGVRFAYIPTTLLSQVDAAIGGKTGVNFKSYKNILGVIRQPEFTFVCPEVLETLPERDFLSGAAELLKTFLIEDGGRYAEAVDFLAGLRRETGCRDFLRENRAELLSLVRGAAAVKAGIVSRDQFEAGERRKLNLGHTFAHAIEKKARQTGDDITHGEAVAIGTVLAAELSEKTSLAEKGLADRLRQDFSNAGLPTDCPYPVADLAEAMSKDKKAENGIIHFILPVAPGDVRICDMKAEQAAELLTDTETI